ncbi:hypothetical protein HDE_01241 [Halotydeus destructor]|nr:hypothetical protein HDE_01241 [Halotydeus destructor]
MKIFIVTVLTILPFVLSDDPLCDRYAKEADDCLLDIMLVGKTSAPVAKTKPQLAIYCNNVGKKTLPCIRKFTDTCMTPFPRSIFNVGFKLMMRQFKRYCYTPEGQTEFVNNAECFEPDTIQAIQKYMDIVTNFADHVVANVTTQEIIPSLCCTYFTVLEMGTKEFTQICGRPKAVEFFVSIVKSVATDLVDIGCGKFSTPDSCYRLLPETMAVFDRIVRPENLKLSPGYTPMIPLVKLMRKLDS